MTGTLEDAHKFRWDLVVAGIPYTHDFGIPTYWRQHPELGSPLGPELDMGGGVTAQAFTGGVVRFTPGVGAELVTE
jgi:hypothetical protein